MANVPVFIIGCGPIGLTGALLLSRHGIRSLLIDKRTAVNTHPRSRFVDTNTMELMRELGIEKAVEDTGLGPEWTGYNRWFSSLTGDVIAEIPSPTFHTVPRDSSPTMPVMTCQDYVEAVLMSRVAEDDNIDMRFSTEALSLAQSPDGTRAVIRNADGSEEEVIADYTVGADGPHSITRAVIDSVLETDPRPNYSQDVIFEADLSEYVEDRKAGLLYALTVNGVLVFQPLNGITRWRCQIFKPDPDILPDDVTIARIREAIGSDQVDISIKSTGIWKPTPGCTSKLGEGRIFLAGDAAHVTVPTGGMGNNVGFAGIRNLAWKLAYVIKGYSPASILGTYHEEHRPLALERIATGVQTTGFMGKMIGAYYKGEDTGPGIALTQQYAMYDGKILGFELTSPLIGANDSAAPATADPVRDFIPAIRAGRRAPHVWIDEADGQSILDWFGRDYVLVMGSKVDAGAWEAAKAAIAASSELPVAMRQLPAQPLSPYDDHALVLVRPDGIIADTWRDGELAGETHSARLSRHLPLIAA